MTLQKITDKQTFLQVDISLAIYAPPNNLTVCSTKPCNCLGRSLILYWVNMKDKINVTMDLAL